MIAFISSMLIRSEPGGIPLVSLARSGPLEERIDVPPSSVILVSDRSAMVRSPRGMAAGGVAEDSAAARSGPNCTGISRSRAPSRVRYILELSIDTLR